MYIYIYVCVFFFFSLVQWAEKKPVKYLWGLPFLKSFICNNLNTIQQLELTTIGRTFYITKGMKIISFSLIVQKNSFISFYNIMYIDLYQSKQEELLKVQNHFWFRVQNRQIKRDENYFYNMITEKLILTNVMWK